MPRPSLPSQVHSQWPACFTEGSRGAKESQSRASAATDRRPSAKPACTKNRIRASEIELRRIRPSLYRHEYHVMQGIMLYTLYGYARNTTDEGENGSIVRGLALR